MLYFYTDAQIHSADNVLDQTVQVVKQVYEDLGQTSDVKDITVSFDGTWQKRGFTAKHGVGTCIDVQTGLVIDYQVMTKHCQACALKKSTQTSDDEFQLWFEQHKSDCCINHTGSSKSMEQEAALMLWNR